MDVREKFEFETYSADLENIANIPFSELENEIENLPKDKTILLICNNGLRSKTAAKYLHERGFENLLYVEGGLVKWQQNGMKMLGNPPDFISHSLPLSKDCHS